MKFPSRYDKYQKKKHRIVSEILHQFDESLYQELLSWFNDNIILIFDYCFARGLALYQEDWAQLIWYKNKIGENIIDTIINIEDFKRILIPSISYGTRNGGTTIQLPFGFVQWHSPSKKIPGDMQFHHSYDKLICMIKEYHYRSNNTNNDFYIEDSE